MAIIIDCYLIMGGRNIDPDKDISFLRGLEFSQFVIIKSKVDRKSESERRKALKKGFFGIIFFTEYRQVIERAHKKNGLPSKLNKCKSGSKPFHYEMR